MSLPTGSYNPAEISFRDAGNEIGRFSCYGALVTGGTDGNFDAQNTLWTAVQTKIAAITLGAKVKAVYSAEVLFTNAQPTNGAARETKLLVQFQNSVDGRSLSATIPTLNPAPTIVHYVVNKNVKDAILLTEPTVITDVITALQNFCVDPLTGDPLTVVGLRVVGRNI